MDSISSDDIKIASELRRVWNIQVLKLIGSKISNSSLKFAHFI